MNTVMNSQLENDLANLVHKHPDVLGHEFQAAALRVAVGYYPDSELTQYLSTDDLTKMLVAEVATRIFKDGELTAILKERFA
ncbi:hypothetical protein [Pseudohaliea sp.]|uniref:hypothetical protein n=1 Tax=Pseudohaliea sp. TaxID=2740289 RepID=UPI0032EDC2EF